MSTITATDARDWEQVTGRVTLARGVTEDGTQHAHAWYRDNGAEVLVEAQHGGYYVEVTEGGTTVGVDITTTHLDALAARLRDDYGRTDPLVARDDTGRTTLSAGGDFEGGFDIIAGISAQTPLARVNVAADDAAALAAALVTVAHVNGDEVAAAPDTCDAVVDDFDEHAADQAGLRAAHCSEGLDPFTQGCATHGHRDDR